MGTRLYEDGAAGAGPRTSWIARAAQGMGALAAALRADLARPAMNRRVLHRLSTLSERELKDIGLTRQDVADAAGSGHRDATRLLIDRRDARRSGRAAFARPW